MGSITPSPEIRWGIIGAGMISSWFVSDLTIVRPNAPVTHTIGAIGSSSISKGEAFVSKHLPNVRPKPTLYPNYESVYNDPNVDVVYIGTPHSFHKQNCLDAIAAGKNILCEKPFAINTREAVEVLAAAKAKGVFVMEALWTRFHPLMTELRRQLFEEKVIGDVRRTFCDFGLDMPIANLAKESRLKQRELGAGSLLDIGIYSLTWGLMTLDDGIGEDAKEMDILASQTLVESVDVATSVLLKYKQTGRQAILTSTLEAKSEEVFCRVEGTEGSITVSGVAASSPSKFVVYPKIAMPGKGGAGAAEEGKEFKFEFEGMGFHFEADAVALDVMAGRKENAVMPHSETLRVMRIMDEVRRQGGASFPQDGESTLHGFSQC